MNITQHLFRREEDLSPSVKSEAFKNNHKDQLARGLGWFSIALGLAVVMAPRSFARFLGTRNHGVLFRIMGLREVASGVGILTWHRPAGWLWARVGGDIVDLVGLRKAIKSK